MKNLTIVLLVAAFFAVSCGDSGSSKSDKSETSESKTEKSEVKSEVKIGDQIWMTKNLNVDKFRNGDPIPEANTVEAWEEAGKNKQPAWCYYNNDPANGEAYGKLYNWYAVNDSRGLAPEGWRIPNNEDWTELADFLGGLKVAGEKMKSTSGWSDQSRGTNESGFSALAGGTITNIGFNNKGSQGSWWSSTEENKYKAWKYSAAYIIAELNTYTFGKEAGISVRCIKK